MSKIFKNMIPYWKSILVILVLLFVQAWCDLSLPSYTSDIIDVGIQNSGVEHVTPKRITEEEFQTAKFIMTDDEADLWESLYTKKDGYYERNKASEKELDTADETLTVALLMNYQMGAMEETAFKQLVAQQTGQDASAFENMTIEQIGEMMHVELKSFQQEKEDSASGSGAPSDAFGDLEYTSDDKGKRSIDSSHSRQRIMSFFGRVNYEIGRAHV